MKKFYLPLGWNSSDLKKVKTLQPIKFNSRENFENYRTLKLEYGLSAKSLWIYQEKSKGKNLYVLLERRLDWVLVKMNFSSSLRESRQIILHGYVTVNSKTVWTCGYCLNDFDVIFMNKKSYRVLKKNYSRFNRLNSGLRENFLVVNQSRHNNLFNLELLSSHIVMNKFGCKSIQSSIKYAKVFWLNQNVHNQSPLKSIRAYYLRLFLGLKTFNNICLLESSINKNVVYTGTRIKIKTIPNYLNVNYNYLCGVFRVPHFNNLLLCSDQRSQQAQVMDPAD